MSLNLRPYQQSAIDALRRTMAEGYRRIILSSPTGSGKTEMGFEIIRGAQAKGRKVAFLANRIHLVDQTCRRLALAGFSFGVIQGSNTRNPWSSVLVASIQTVARRGMPDVDLIVIDEAHACAGTSEYRKIMAGKPVIGLSATPYSKGLGKHYDELGGALFERVVTAARIEDLIRDGYLVSADIWAPADPDLTGVRTVAGDYDEKQLGQAMDKAHLVGDIVEHWIRLAHGTPTVVFATSIAHSKHIVDQFVAHGVKAEHIDCYTSADDRRAVLERVANGETTVLSNVGILAEGWDFPACKTLILARPTKSLIRYLQMAGRVLRPYPGKTKAIILDHSGTVVRLGMPWDYFGQHLDDGKPKKGESEKERKEPLPKACPDCSYMMAPRTKVCPSCGHEVKAGFDITTEDGELVPLTGQKVSPAIEQLRAMGKESIYSQLSDYAASKGYAVGWVKNKYREIWGVWPRGVDGYTETPSPALLSWIRSRNIAWAKSKRGAA